MDDILVSEDAAALHRTAKITSVETIPQQDSAEKAFNKLARTFVKS